MASVEEKKMPKTTPKYQPLVTVIMPFFNAAELLTRSMDSLVNQSYQNIEIILIDDGSEDSSLSLCKSYSSRDKRIKVYTQLNAGAAAARNYAISLATGTYVCFLDSDDWIERSYIATLVELAERNNADISACSYYHAYEDGTNTVIKNRPTFRSFSNIEAVRDVLSEESLLETMLWNKLYKRDLFDINNITMPVGNIYEDSRILYKLLYFSKKTILVDKPLYFYFQRRDSVMHYKVQRKNVELLMNIPKETAEWLNNKTKGLNLELNSYELTGIINALNYMVDGGTIYKDIYRALRKRTVLQFSRIWKNSYISFTRKILAMLLIFGGYYPYSVVRKAYIKLGRNRTVL